MGTATNDDTNFTALPIGFTFNFNNVDYTTFSVNANGFMVFGSTITSSYTSLSTGASNNVVAALNGDLQGNTSTGELSYLLQGTAPNQTLTIQWKSYRNYAATGDDYNFQIVLHETTNVIDVVYGTFIQNATARTRQVGLRGEANTIFNSRNSTTDWSTTNPSFLNSNTCALTTAIIPASGLTYSWTPPTCPGSTTTGLTATAITANSATISWAQPTNLPANGYEYVVSTSDLVPAGSGTAEATNSLSISSLTSNTTYYVYVRAICGTDIGAWVPVGIFKTLCDDVDAFVQNFEGLPTGTGNLPDCWAKAGTSANVYTTTGSVAPMSPANRLYMNISATTTAFALLPNVSNLQADTHRLRFKAYATSANKSIDVGYFTDPSDLSTFVAIQNVSLPSTAATTAIEFSIVPTAIPVGVTRLVLSLVAGASTTAYIDDVKWEFNSQCAEPNTLTATSISNIDAVLGWVNGGTASEFEIQYGASNFVLGTGTIVSGIMNNSYTLGSLSASTTYSYYVRAVCSTIDISSWAGPFTFTTQCDEVTDFFENFDSYTTNFSSTMPVCWSRGGTSTSTYITTGSAAPMSASNRLYMFASGTTPTEGYAILPPVSNLAAGTHRLKFKAYATSVDRIVQIGYLTDVADVTTFVQLEEVLLPSANLASTQEIIVIPAGIPTGVKNLAILNPGYPGSSTTAYIDDVAWEPIPDCANPTLVNATAVTSNSVIIGWTGNASDVTWEIEYGAPGFTLGTGTIVPAATNPFTLTALTPETAYQFYVRAVCAASTSTSSLSGSFTTACAAIIPDYTQDFATFVPNCWNRAGAGDITTGPTGTASGSWFGDGFGNNGFSGAVSTNVYLADGVSWLISPIFDLTSGGYRVRYDVAATDYGSTTAPAVLGADDKVQFVMSSDGGATWTSMEVYDTTNIPSVASTTKIYNLPTTSANVIFAFLAEEGPGASTDWEFFIDNFVVETPPAAAPGCATNIVATPDASCGNFPFNITWDTTPTATGYKISVGTTTGGTDIENDLDLGLVTSYSYAAPTLNTTYYFTVKPYNSIGEATGCVEQSLITATAGCYCPSEPTSVDGVGITNVQMGTIDVPISVTAAPYYSNQTATVYNMNQGISNNVKISFNTSFYDYNTYIYVDLNDDFNFDASELLFTGVSSSTSPNVYDASFVMPATAPIGNHRMRIVTADYMPVGNENPCYSGGYGFTVDFTINVQVPSCSPAAATATVSPDCANSQFYVDVVVTSLGNGTPSISDGTVSIPVTALGTIQVGPYADGTSVSLNLLHGSDATCDVSLGSFNYVCPPANDNLCDAILLTINATTTGTDYTMLGATAQTNEPAPTCFSGGINGSVWFKFVAPSSGTVTVTTDFSGGSLTDGDTEIAVYNATGVTCQDLSTLSTSIGCDQDGGTTVNYSSILPLSGLTDGDTYYIQVDRYSGTTAGTFGIQVTAALGLNEFEENTFVAYPNPVKDVLNLSYSLEMSSVKVINLLGQVVVTKALNSTETQLDLTSLQAGTYLVQVTVGTQVKTIKIVKQ